MKPKYKPTFIQRTVEIIVALLFLVYLLLLCPSCTVTIHPDGSYTTTLDAIQATQLSGQIIEKYSSK